ncbi:hypothetical protein M378DRAFT_184632 [Amanita muscaria Koide BX008]|uniref:CxC2-like cysteine cluster KDZ transposase-associated domain-containing protein n=1 Tax=Amanita muscaria (strain Koide BX008) TaxID=946122 RepID=A0A0C2XGW3_AMAMK|nr:hypothetical protein M378DRAFT_184632 [Amanita muscaria Koide BX008]
MSKRPFPSTQESSRKRGRAVFCTARRTLKDKNFNGNQEPSPASATSPFISSHVFTLRTNNNGRRARYQVDAHRHHQNQLSPPTFEASLVPEDEPPAVNPATVYEESEIEVDMEAVPPAREDVSSPKKTRMQSNTTSTKLKEWLAFRQTCLDEMLRHDGRGDFLNCQSCVACGMEEGLYKCHECFNGSLLRCQSCLVGAHGVHPLHRVEKWNGFFFEKVSLRDLGLVVQLGHGGAKCIHPAPGPKGFSVFDISGVHRVTINYCDCGKDGFTPYRVQILRAGWFPATFNRPKTVFTFACLDFFHELTLQGKTSLYDFYHTILRRTDNLELNNKIYCYAQFHRIFRIWRGLLMLKRAGRGQDPAGAEATAQGELALECPACPHPERNLPDGWQKVSPGLRFLYTLFLAVDANFKLKQKSRGILDPELYPGWAYFINEGPYQDFINDYTDQPEINTCQSEHDAIVRAAVRNTPGYRVTGTVLIICPRHGLVRKNGAGDLQKGERYCNVDYVLLSSLVGLALLRIVITYDIACQWSKNFLRRMELFPSHMRLRSGTEVVMGVPSWHINGHGADCRANFSLGYMEGMGRTCGEEIETSWAQTNALGTSTREMGTGARHETLNDHWGGFNFRKITGFRVLFLKRLKEAYVMQNKHRDIFNKFSATFSSSTIEKWEKMLFDWTADPSKPNPFEEPVSATSLQDVRLELTKEDAAEARANETPRSIKATLTSFFMTGLDLEEQQRLLRIEANQIKKSATPKQRADLEDKRTLMFRQIQRWRDIQLVYTPCVGCLLAASLSAATLDGETVTVFSEPAELISLYLPSSLPTHLRQLPEMLSVVEKECRLRVAQADDALADIRRQCRITSGLWQFKCLNVSRTGNKPNTRMHTLFNRFNLRTQRCAQRYRAAWKALLALDPDGSWRTRLQELRDADIRGPGKDDLGDKTTSNGRFEPSWIWLVPRVLSAPDMESSEETLDDSMRVEWMKSRARKERWEEEVLLVEEEMRRVICYFEWKARWWWDQRKLRTSMDLDIVDGVAAYASKQASYCKRMAESCVQFWLPFFTSEGVVVDWASQDSYIMSKDEEDEEDEENEEIDDGNEDMDISRATDVVGGIDRFELEE